MPKSGQRFARPLTVSLVAFLSVALGAMILVLVWALTPPVLVLSRGPASVLKPAREALSRVTVLGGQPEVEVPPVQAALPVEPELAATPAATGCGCGGGLLCRGDIP